MIRTALSLALLAFLAAGCGKKPPTDAQVMAEAKKILHASCLKSGAKLPGLTVDQLERFCVCTTDKVAAIMGPDGIRGLATRGQPSEDVQEQLRQAGRDCVDVIR